MEARRFRDTDYEAVSTWYTKRGLDAPSKQYLPEVGFIIPGVACAHLFKTDGGFAILEGFISNPDTTPEERVRALDEIINQLTTAAREFGFSRCMAFTNHPTISIGCTKNNFFNLGEFSLFGIEV